MVFDWKSGDGTICHFWYGCDLEPYAADVYVCKGNKRHDYTVRTDEGSMAVQREALYDADKDFKKALYYASALLAQFCPCPSCPVAKCAGEGHRTARIMHHAWALFSGITTGKVQRQNRIGRRRLTSEMGLWEISGNGAR